MNRSQWDKLSDDDKYNIVSIFWDKCKDERWCTELVRPYFINLPDDFWDDLADPVLPMDVFIAQFNDKQEKIANDITSRLDAISQVFSKRKENAVVKGDNAETIMEEVISERWECERTSHLPYQADFSVYMKIDRRYRVIIDIKNYTNTIPSGEYEKFIRDIKNTQADGGVYFAYSGSVSGRVRNISMDSTSKTPIVIVQNSEPESMHLALDIIRTYFTMHSKSYILDLDNIQYYVDQSLDQINQLYVVKSHISKCASTVSEQLGNAQLDLAESISKLQTYMSQICSRLQIESTDWLETDTTQIENIIHETLPALGPRNSKEVISVLISVCLELEKRIEGFKVKHQGNKLQLGTASVKLGSRKQTISIPTTNTDKILEIIQRSDGSASYNGTSITWEVRRKNASAIMDMLSYE
jgi:hypothetical protein